MIFTACTEEEQETLSPKMLKRFSGYREENQIVQVPKCPYCQSDMFIYEDLCRQHRLKCINLECGLDRKLRVIG